MKNIKLSANEALMLLALNDEDGKVRWSASPYLDHALAGAILVELEDRGILKTIPQGLQIDDSGSPSDSPLLRSAAESLRAKFSTKPIPFPKAIGIILDHQDMTQKQMEELVARGILARQEEHFLFVFASQIYPTVDSRPERLLIRRMRELILQNVEGDRRLRAVIGLAYTAHLLRGPLSAQELEDAVPKLKKLVEENPVVGTTNDLVRASEQALYMATTSSFGGVPQV